MWKPLWAQKEFDRFADQAARPVRWRHLIGLAGFGILALRVDPWWYGIKMFVVLLWLALAFQPPESLKYFRERGIDPYNAGLIRTTRSR